jgi:hypothetical protein
MSNEYKDWLWDHVQDIVLERGLVDKITHVEPNDPALGAPHHIWGLKNGEPVKYYVHYDPTLGWLCEHRELDT